MLFDYLIKVNERYKEKIYKGGYRLIFIAEYLIESNFLLLLKVSENLIEI